MIATTKASLCISREIDMHTSERAVSSALKNNNEANRADQSFQIPMQYGRACSTVRSASSHLGQDFVENLPHVNVPSILTVMASIPFAMLDHVTETYLMDSHGDSYREAVTQEIFRI